MQCIYLQPGEKGHCQLACLNALTSFYQTSHPVSIRPLYAT